MWIKRIKTYLQRVTSDDDNLRGILTEGSQLNAQQKREMYLIAQDVLESTNGQPDYLRDTREEWKERMAIEMAHHNGKNNRQNDVEYRELILDLENRKAKRIKEHLNYNAYPYFYING